MLGIDLTGKRALVAGVADDGGFGFAIAKALAEAGATVAVGTWPPALTIFQTMLSRGKFDASMTLSTGAKMSFAKVYPLDAEYDRLDEVPAEVKESRRYRECGDFTIHGVAAQMQADFGGVDIVIHSLANGPEVKKPLTETSRKGYLAALSASAYSFVSMVQAFGPIMPAGGSFLSLSYMASQRVVPWLRRRHVVGQGRARERHPHAGLRGRPGPGQRVNVISAGPFASRAASAIGFIDQMVDYAQRNAPIAKPITAEDVGATAAFLASPLAAGITGTTIYVDMGFHSMGLAVDREGAKPA
jgi:enoyl-[acyl-carrier protein] reductase I